MSPFSRLMPLLADNHDLLQFLISAAGTLAGICVVVLAFVFFRKSTPGKIPAVPLAFALLVVAGCLSSFAPLGSVNGDGAVHQEKMWFMSQALRHGRVPEWSFFWFGGGLLNEFYGPLDYILFALPMAVLGLSSKWSIGIAMVACAVLSAALIVRRLSPAYGVFAATVAAACHVFSPARTGSFWYDGTPHRLVIDFICLVYLLYLWRNRSRAPAWQTGFFLGLAASAAVYFHLQFGGMAAALMGAFTAVILGFERRVDLVRPVIAGVTALAVFLPTAGLHYLYFFVARPDFVAQADSLVYMISPVREWLPNLAVALTWDWSSHTWEMHYFGLVPVILSVLGVAWLFNVDRFAFFSGVFALLILVVTAAVPRFSVFGPVFFVPTVAAVVHYARSRLAPAWSEERMRVAGLAVALVVLVDLYPSAFQVPYRPGSGDRPVAEALAALGPSRGRIVVSSPDKQYGNDAADRFPGVPTVDSPSIFGPTFQLSPRWLGYAAMISRQAWLEFAATGTLSERTNGYLALLDVSDILLYKRDEPVVHKAVANFRPAWRIEAFICDEAAAPLTKLNWDDIRALGQGQRNDPFDNDDEIAIDAARGTVRGLRIDCGPGGAARWAGLAAPAAGADAVTAVRYDAVWSTAEFSVDAARPGLFVLPFGYVADLRVEAGGERLDIGRTNEWMSVVALPAGHSDIRITGTPRQTLLRRTLDAIFIVLLIGGIAAASLAARRRRHDSGSNMKPAVF
jgi:hypothetical protein